MSYNLSIVRQDDWQDANADSTITLNEWINYAESDSELILDSDQKIYTKCYKWIGYPNSNDIPWFAYDNGAIFSKNPDLYVIKKMLSIAAALNSKVRGEEFEYYDEENFKF